MQSRPASRRHTRIVVLPALLLVSLLALIPACQTALAQDPPATDELSVVNEEELWVEREKDGGFRARPLFSLRLSTLYYGVRDSDTGEWLTTLHRVTGGEKKRDEGWEYEIEYPALDDHPDLDPERTFLLVMVATAAGQTEPSTFYGVIRLREPGGFFGGVISALDPSKWARAAATWVIEGVHGTLCGVLAELTGEDPEGCDDDTDGAE